MTSIPKTWSEAVTIPVTIPVTTPVTAPVPAPTDLSIPAEPGVQSSSAESTRITLPTLILLAVITSFGALSLDLYLPGLPTLQRDLHATAAQAQLTVTACIAGLAVGQLCCGLLADMVGRRKPMLAGAAVWVGATLACSVVGSIPELIALRVVQGAAAGVGIALTRSVIADRDPGRMVTYLSRMFLVLAAVPVVAPTLGALLIEVAGWRKMFLVLGGVGSIYLFCMIGLLKESLPVEQRSPVAVSSALQTSRALLRNPRFVRMTVVSGLTLGVMFTYISASAFIFRDAFGLSAVQYGVLFGANAVALITGIQLSGPVLRRFGAPRAQVTAGALGSLAAMLFVVDALVLRHSLAAIVIPLACVLFCTGVLMPSASANAMTSDSSALPGASGVMGAVQFGIGGGVGALATAALSRPSAVELASASLACLALATLLVLPSLRTARTARTA